MFAKVTVRFEPKKPAAPTGKEPKKGDTFAMPATLARSLCRFHLVDNTRGEPSYWSSQELRKADMKWTVKEVSDGAMKLELAGSALLSTDAKGNIRGGMSGSPIVSSVGHAVGVLCTSASIGGPNPFLAAQLPGWLAAGLLKMPRRPRVSARF